MNKYFNFHTKYRTLPEIFYQNINPTPVSNPSLFLYNQEYAKQIAVFKNTSKQNIVAILSGNKIAEGSKPLAQAYCGHQFSYLSELGDGRAVLLGEHISPDNNRLDVQLKGAGKTKYSNRGDGRATLGSMIREYLISEAMYNLNIKTTRALAVIKTGEKVKRGGLVDGAILTRVANSHLRVGTFQFAALQKDDKPLKQLADYTIERHFKNLKNSDQPYFSLFKQIANNQMDLIVDWMRVGFVHGVMNTDNVSVSAETLDYGPCAFIDAYNTSTVFSSIDVYGRYSYGNQAFINGWNMARLAESLIPLIADTDEKALGILNQFLSQFMEIYTNKYMNMMARKIGFKLYQDEDKDLLNILLNMMRLFNFDYTNTFVYLRSILKPLNIDNSVLMPYNNEIMKTFNTWINEWKIKLEKKSQSLEETINIMEKENPIIIPRNIIVEKAIKSAEKGNSEKLNYLIKILKKPYDYQFNNLDYILVSNKNKPFVTYCGT